MKRRASVSWYTGMLLAMSMITLVLLVPIRRMGAQEPTPPKTLGPIVNPATGSMLGQSLTLADKLKALTEALPPGSPVPDRLNSVTLLHVGRPDVPGVAWLHCEGVVQYGSRPSAPGQMPPAIVELPYIFRRDRGQPTAPFCEVSFLPPTTARNYVVTLNICWNGGLEAPGFVALKDQPPTFQLTTSLESTPFLRAINPDPRVFAGTRSGIPRWAGCGPVVVPLIGVMARRQFVRIAPIASGYLAEWWLVSIEIDQAS